MLMFGLVPTLLMDKAPDAQRVIGLIDSTGTLFAPLSQDIQHSTKLANGQPAYVLQNFMRPGVPIDSSIATADRQILKDKDDVVAGTLVVRDSAGHLQVTLRTLNPSDIRTLMVFNSAVEKQINTQRLLAAHIDTAAYNRAVVPIDVNMVKVTEKGGDSSIGFMQTFFSAYVGIILFMILILTTGQTLVRSLVEEKSNRIMELLVSSATPSELMWGKLLGLSGLGVTQILVWALFGVAAVTQMSMTISPSVLAPVPLMLVYLILGYMLYASLFVGVGSLVTTEQEAQVVTSYLSMMLAAPLAFSMMVIQSPDAGYVRTLSYIPLLTPSLMMLRLSTKMPSTGEILATIGMMILSICVVTWAAGKVFRTAILMYGKRPTMREVMRWIRA
jgi:ABC-2 type transport system permease protein